MPLVLSGGATFTGGIQGRAPAAVVAPAATDSYSMYNSLLLLGNGTNNSQNNTFLDSSTNNFSITRNGNTTQGTFSPYGSNWSNYFDGSGDYLTTPSSSNLDVGNTSWTIECWIYMNNTSGTQTIMGYNNLSATDFWDLIVVSGVPTFRRRISSSDVLVAGGTISTNTFTHVAVVRNGTAVTLYLNGSSVATNANLSMPTSMSDRILGIGANRYSAGYDYYFNGFISNLRIVIGTAVYTGNFTPSTTPLTAIANTQLLTCQSNRFVDNSTNAFAITRNGDTSIQRFSPFSPTAAYSSSTIGGSAYFDGNSDYLSVPDNDSWALGNNFTIECWVYFTTTSGIQQFINQRASSSNAWQFLYNYPNSGDLTFKFEDGNVAINRTWSPTVGRWYHIAVTRSSSTWYLFANGVQLGATATNSTTFPNIAATVWVGTLQNPTAESFVGYMCDMRVVKSSVYTTAFTPPTAPLTAVANTQLLLNYTNGGIIDSAMINNLETLGNSKISTTQSKFGGSSMYFDGTGDFLYVPASPNGVLGNTWTIECWYQATSRSNTYPVIISVTDGNSDYANTIALFDRHNSASSNFSFAVGSGTLTVGTTTVSNGTWYHLALVSNGGVVTLYVNGVSEVSASRTTGSVNKAFYVGANFDYASYPTYLNGYIDDLRVTKGYARYTANFTPPTAELPGQ